ncbi:MAG: flagellar basal body P-ring formation protein FlgA [Petrotoga sp.]|nr:flagellar basal body P-ring formation protein FlgA [Petrotoga sp.]
MTLTRLIKIIFFSVMLFASSIVFSSIVFTIPAVIFSEDWIFSLKDIFPEMKSDRTISYIVNDKIIYSEKELSKILYGLMSSYYSDFDLVFEESTVTVVYKNESPDIDVHYIDLESFLQQKIKEYDNSLTVNSIDLKVLPEKVLSAEVIRIFQSYDKLYISLNVLDDKNNQKTLTVIANVSKYEKVLVYSKDLTRGTMLNEELTEPATKNALTINNKPIDVELLKSGSYELTKDVKKGEIVDATYLRRIPDVKAGDIVTVLVEFEGITVSTLARAMINANFGDTLSVRNVENGNIITGKLKEGPILQVSLGGSQK